MLPKSDGNGWPSLREIEAASVGGLFHLLMRPLYVTCWHKTDLPMQSPHVRCWGNNGSRISVLRLVFRRRMSLARRKLEQRGSRACPNLLALLASQSAGKIVHACRRYVAQRT